MSLTKEIISYVENTIKRFVGNLSKEVYKNSIERHSHVNKSLLDTLTNSGSGTNYLANDGTYKSASGSIPDGDKGDITVSGGGTVWTIDNLAVTNAKINDVDGSKVTQSASFRLVTDTEKSTWNSKPVSIAIHANATANITLTNQALAEGFLAGNNRNITRYDLTGFTQAKLVARVVTGSASVNNPRIRLMYDLVSGGFSTTIGNYTNIASSGEVACSLTNTGVIDSGWVNITATAQTDVYLAVTQIGGDATADPALGMIMLYLK